LIFPVRWNLFERYNQRKDDDILQSEVLEDFTNEIIDMYHNLKKEMNSFKDMGIDFEEKAFYDILKQLAHKYDFSYPEDKLIILAGKVKEVVDDKAKYTDWSKREDIKAELKVDLSLDNEYSGLYKSSNDEKRSMVTTRKSKFFSVNPKDEER